MWEPAMRRIQVYVDTSVFGGTADEEFAAATGRFFQRVHRGEIVVLVSQVTLDELAGAPHEVQQVLKDLPDDCLVQVRADEEAMDLAQAYLDAGILSTSGIADAIHVAAATVAGADMILSWNFRHIVNYHRIRKYNGVNALRGYAPVEIHSPLEMSYDEQG
jgi:predicted nucleic acid-binding protein